MKSHLNAAAAMHADPSHEPCALWAAAPVRRLDHRGVHRSSDRLSCPMPKTRRTSAPNEKKLRSFAIEAAQLLADLRCEDVKLMDVRGLSQVCDYVLIGSGTSDRQMKSVAHELEEL